MFRLPSPLEEIQLPLFEAHGVKIFIKRDDLIHPEVSGNKWRKLKKNIEFAKSKGLKGVVTMGGAYSNHIAATAAACSFFNLEGVGIIRGEELTPTSNPTLIEASKNRMNFQFIEREDYRNIRKNSSSVKDLYPDHLFIPEGGANDLGIDGVSQLLTEINIDFDHLITSVGTGTTLLGLVKGLAGQKSVLGMSSIKGATFEDEILQLKNQMSIPWTNYEVNQGFHFGGYGKYTDELIDFINQAKAETGILFDPIYTGKAFFGVCDMVKSRKFDNQTLIFLHTGGLQGIEGFNQKSPRKIHF